MTATDTARAVLALASAYDSTTPRPDGFVLAAWAKVLGNADKADALAVVEAHYSQPDARRIGPGDVLHGVRKIRAERIERSEGWVPDADPDDVEAYIAAIRAGRYRCARGDARPVADLVLGAIRELPA